MGDGGASKTAKRSNVPDILFSCYFILYIVLQLSGIPRMFANGVQCVLGCIALLYVLQKHRDARCSSLIAIYCLASVTPFLCSMAFTGNTSIEDLLWIPTYAGISFLLLLDRVDYRVVRTIFYLAAAVIAVEMMRGVDPNHIFEGASRNTVSAQMIFFGVLLAIAQYRQVGTVPITAAAIVLMLSVYGEGRSGVMLGSAFSLVIFWHYLFFQRGLSVFKSLIVMASVALVAYLFSVYLSDSLNAIARRMDHRGMDSPRYEIWGEYASLVVRSPASSILGASMRSSPLIASYSYNLHNSYLMLHAKFGLLYLTGFSALFLHSLYRLVKNRQLLMVALLSIAFARCFVDSLAFPGLYDVLFICFLFEPLMGGAFGERLLR